MDNPTDVNLVIDVASFQQGFGRSTREGSYRCLPSRGMIAALVDRNFFQGL